MATYGMAQLVEQQARRWEKTQGGAKQKAPRPGIAISRLPYSGATELAHKLGARLDFGVFGHQIVDEIAAEEGVSASLVAGLDEHVENAIERHVLDGFRHRNFTESDYLRDAMKIVSTLGMRGQTIIVGRGSACILPAEHTLRVLVAAPVEWRRARLRDFHKLAADDAKARLEREDAGRAEFWRHHFGVELTDYGLYDLMVNVATLSIDGGVSLIEAAFRRRFPV